MFTALFYLLAGWLVFQLIFPFLTVLAARWWGRERRGSIPNPAPDFACIITAYRNLAIARPLVESLLNQTWQQYHIYLVADDCPGQDWLLNAPRLTVLRPGQPLRLKIRSISLAMAQLVRPHSHTVIFDADNLAHPYFLENLLPGIGAGYACVQGRRTAKNLDNGYAATDSLGELYKNYIERYAPYLLGGSAVISGSGMATETGLYTQYLHSPDIAEGHLLGKKMLQEDKILQNFLLRRNAKIGYAWEAICYDEKVETGDAVQTQRSRWLYSYFQNIPNALGILGRGLAGARANQFFFGIVTLALPMFIQVGLAVLVAVAGWWINPVATVVIAAALAVFAGNVLWTLRLSGAPGAVWQAVWKVPRFVGRQVLALFKMVNPDKNFRHSEHGKVMRVEEVMEDQP